MPLSDSSETVHLRLVFSLWKQLWKSLTQNRVEKSTVVMTETARCRRESTMQ